MVLSSLSHYRSLFLHSTHSETDMQARLFALLVTAGLLLLIDFYFYQGTKDLWKSASATSQTWLSRIYWFISISGIALIGSVIIFRMQARAESVAYWFFVGYIILYFAKFFGLIPLLLDDIQRILRYLFQLVTQTPSAERGITRTEFLSKAAVGLAAIPAVSMLSGIVFGAHAYLVKNNRLVLPKLPKEFEGLKIVHISDIHSGSFWNKTAVERGIEMIMAQKPDMIFFTGDLVNNLATEFEPWKATFGKLKAPMGVYSILGNHDYGDYFPWETPEAKAANLQAVINHHKSIGWNLLLDEHVVIERNGAKIGIVGIQNWGTGRFPKYGSMKKATASMPELPVNLLLSHDPSHWDNEVRKEYKNIDVMFAGHTHGMQFGVNIPGLKWSPVQYRYHQWSGLYKEDNQQLYVNQGFGYIGYPGRIGIRPEITLHELSSTNEA